MGRHVNIIAGRAVHDDGTSRLYGYVNKEVSSAATRLDHFLSEQGVPKDQKITVVSDGAGEFEKAVDGSVRPLTRILDWFHIAMKFRAIEQSAQRFPDLLAPSGRPIGDEIASANWLTWHGKSDEAVERLKRLHDMLDLPPADPAHQPLWWNLRGTYFYLDINRKYLVNYGWRYRRGMPISSSIAESAVNEVVSLRCAKKRQMRWTDKGAHLLVQVRVAALNGELNARKADTASISNQGQVRRSSGTRRLDASGFVRSRPFIEPRSMNAAGVSAAFCVSATSASRTRRRALHPWNVPTATASLRQNASTLCPLAAWRPKKRAPLQPPVNVNIRTSNHVTTLIWKLWGNRFSGGHDVQ
jgi:hypothetical protein